MKIKLLLANILLLASGTIFAQNKVEPINKKRIPSYNNKFLQEKLKEYLDTNSIVSKNVSNGAYIDTIIPMFSQYAPGGNIYSGYANRISAELTSKESRLGYNVAGYAHTLCNTIYNVEVFASGKDNVGSIFNNNKLQGVFGISGSLTKPFYSSLYYDKSDAENLFDSRSQYFWVLDEMHKQLQNGEVKKALEREIKSLDSVLNEPTTLNKEGFYKRIVKLKDSLEKIPAHDKIKEYLEKQIKSFDERAKWTGFNLWMFELKGTYSNEGFTYYQVQSPYMLLFDNARRFSRGRIGVVLHWIYSRQYVGWKLSGGGAWTRMIGFDEQTSKSVTQRTLYDSTGLSREIEKKFVAYQIKPESMTSYHAANEYLDGQIFFLPNKLFGLGYNLNVLNFFGGDNKSKSSFDHSFSLLASIAKKGDMTKRNTLALTLKIPDAGGTLDRSYDTSNPSNFPLNDPRAIRRLSIKEKMEVSLSLSLPLASFASMKR